MRKVFAIVLLSICTFSINQAKAGVTLTCIHELSGQQERVYFESARNADDAQRLVRVDPTYGYYRQCIEENTNRPGADLGPGITLNSADPRLCKSMCDQNAACRAWTYVKPNTTQGPQPKCWLKRTAAAAQEASCCVSGVK